MTGPKVFSLQIIPSRHSNSFKCWLKDNLQNARSSHQPSMCTVCRSLPRNHASSAIRFSSWMLSIMTSSPIVTTTSSPKPNQPSIMAVVPTPLLTLPLPRSCAMMDAATDAVCCQSTLTSTNIEAMMIIASATCDTARLGNGFTSTSDPVRGSDSACHPGKVARSTKVTKAKMMATILQPRQSSCPVKQGIDSETRTTHSRYGNTMLFLKVVATQMRFNGSWSMVICSANWVALLLQRKLPPSGFMQIPKYPTRTSSIALPTMFDIAVTTPGSTCEESNTGVYF